MKASRQLDLFVSCPFRVFRGYLFLIPTTKCTKHTKKNTNKKHPKLEVTSVIAGPVARHTPVTRHYPLPSAISTAFRGSITPQP
jgi:hypothetical protein